MSSGSSSAKSSPSSGKFQQSSQHAQYPHHQQQQQYSSEQGDNFVIPGQHMTRFTHSSQSTGQPFIHTQQSSQQHPVHQSIFIQSNPLNAISNHPLSGFRRSSDATDSSTVNRPSSATDESGPPLATKPGRRFSLAQALSNVNHNSSSPSSSSLFLSKSSKSSIKESIEERKDSVVGPLQSESCSNSNSNIASSSSAELSRSKSPTPSDRPGGRKGSTTSITSINSKQASTSNGGGGKRRQSRIAFFTHRLGSEAIPDMKSLSVNSSSGGKNQGHHFLPNLLGHGHESRKPSETYRLVILGGSKVGKTAIVQRFLYDSFPEAHSATVEELHQADYEVKGLGIVGVEILDTSGSFPFPAMQRLAINSGHAFILVYSVDDNDSFQEVARLREMIISVKSSPTTSSTSVPLVVVANKSDLEEDVRQVATEMAECECIDWDVAFVESSAKTGDNIMNIFHKLLLQAHLKGILKSVDITSSNTKDSSKLKVEKVSSYAKVSNRRRSSLPVNDLFRHLPLTSKGNKNDEIKEDESTEHSASGRSDTSRTKFSGKDDRSGSRTSCILS